MLKRIIGAAIGAEVGKAMDGDRLLALFGALMLLVGAAMLQSDRWRKTLAAVFCWPMNSSETGIKNQSLPFLGLGYKVRWANSSVVTRGMLTILCQPCRCASTERVD